MSDDSSSLYRLRLAHQLVCAAMKLPVEGREAFVAKQCNGDAELEASVLRKLEAVSSDLETRELGVDLSANYEITDQIGSGGMGVVYRAYQKTLQRDVAVKKIKVGQSPLDSAIRVSFLREARAAAAVKHPAIIEIFEFGTLDGEPCIAMELIEGASLAERLVENGKFESIVDAVELVAQLAEAIAVAHKEGVVHRDLKPANVLLDENGSPKISDFGIAKLFEQQTEQLNLSIAGTIGYMAPEQAMGQSSGPSVDIFSLGAVLFALLTGKPPYAAESIESYVALFGNTQSPSARRLNKAVDRRLDAICKKCLEASPAARYQDARKLATDLRRLSARRRRRVQVAVTAAAMTFLLAVGVFFAQRAANFEALESTTSDAKADLDYVTGMNSAFSAWEKGDAELTRSMLMQFVPTVNGRDRRDIEWHWLWGQCNREDVVLDGNAGPIWCLSLSPDGALLATAGDDKRVRIWDRLTKRVEFEFDGHSKAVRAVAFSPDGKLLASGSTARAGIQRSHAELIIWDLEKQTGMVSVPIPHADIEEITFSNDGERIFVMANGLHVFGADGAHIRTVPATGNAFALSPDNSLAAIATGDGNQPSDVSIVDLASGSEVRRLQGHEQYVSAIRFSESGQLILTASWDGSVKKWDVNTGEKITSIDAGSDVVDAVFLAEHNSIAYSTIDKVVSVARGHETDDNSTKPVELLGHSKTAFDLEYDELHQQLLSASKDGTVRIWDTEIRPNPISTPVLRATIAPFRRVRLAPKGDLLAAVIGDAGSASRLSLWSVQDGHAHVQRVPALDGQPVDVAFLSNGEQIAVLSVTDDGDVVTIVHARTAKQIRRFNAGQSHDRIVCSPDDAMVAVSAYNKTGLWTSDGLFKGELPTHSGRATDIAFNSDGRLIAVTCGNSSVAVWDVRSQVAAFELAGHSDGVKSVAFSEDGEFIATGGSYDGIKLWDSKGRNICSFNQENAFVDVTFLPDGKLMSCGMVSSTISMWDAQSHELVETWKSPNPELSGVKCGKDGLFVSSHGKNSTILTVWSYNEKSPIGSITPDGVPFGSIKDIEFAANGKRLFVAGGTADSGVLMAIDAESGAIVSSKDIHASIAQCVAASNDGSWLATCSDDQTIKLLDANTLEELTTLEGHAASVMDVAFSEKANQLISAGGYDGTVRIWDHLTGGELRRFNFEPHSFVLSARYAQDGKTILVARNNQGTGIIEAINLGDGEQIYRIETPRFASLTTSPCGRLAAYCDGSSVSVFHAGAGTKIKNLKAATNSAVFSQSGSRLLIADVDTRFFDTKTYKRTAAFNCEAGRPEHVTLDADGKYFAAASSNGVVTIWRTTR